FSLEARGAAAQFRPRRSRPSQPLFFRLSSLPLFLFLLLWPVPCPSYPHSRPFSLPSFLRRSVVRPAKDRPSSKPPRRCAGGRDAGSSTNRASPRTGQRPCWQQRSATFPQVRRPDTVRR